MPTPMQLLLMQGQGGRDPNQSYAQRRQGGPMTQNLSGGFAGMSPSTPTDARTSASNWDTGQKLGGMASSLMGLGPVGLLAGLGAGQYARVKANQAYPGQEPIGFWEDVTKPDVLFGSPEDIQKERFRISRGKGGSDYAGGSRHGTYQRGGSTFSSGYGSGDE